MKNFNCLIVDDEPIARKILLQFVEKTPFLTFCGEAENAIKADSFLKENHVDLMFIDIDMPKVSGLEFIKSSQIKPMVIITTAFPEYALEGYELDIIDYLLKPIHFNRFVKAVQKAKEYSELKDGGLPNLLSSYIFVRCEKRIEKLELKEILYIESLGNYINIYLEDRKLIAYLTLKGLEAQLPKNEFLKIHQSYLVSFSKIKSIVGNQVLINDKSLPISRNYKDVIMNLIEQKLLKR
jgi:DNA-binding LytR/AlgR family response regulator